MLTQSYYSIKERVYQFRQELNLQEDFLYLEQPDLTPGANGFLNALEALNSYYSQSARPPLSQSVLAQIGRQAYEMLSINFGGVLPEVIKNNLTVNQIPVRLYKANSQDSSHLIIYVHGGGWTRGSLETHDVLCARLCFKTGWDVLAVDYRLAPEHPYPAALNDTNAVYNWARQQYKIVVLSGDSAGGNLVTALTLKLRNNNLPQPKAIMLFYPSFDLRITTHDHDIYADGYFLTRQRINQFVSGYLGHNIEKAAIDPLISPIIEKDLNDFPYVVMVLAECDPLCKEAEDFALKLKAAGNQIDYLVIPKVLHAFAQFFDLYPEAEKALDYMVEKLQRTKD